jgi:hypothetical protein
LPVYDQSLYKNAEKIAQAKKIGLWGLKRKPIRPSVWRKSAIANSQAKKTSSNYSLSGSRHSIKQIELPQMNYLWRANDWSGVVTLHH